MELIRRTKGLRKAAVTRLEQRWMKICVEPTQGQLQQLQQKGAEVSQQLEDLLVQLMTVVDVDDNDREELQGEILDLEERLQELTSEVMESMAMFRASEVRGELKVEAPAYINQVKLPVIDLPTFHGRIQDWISFRESFTALIQSNHQLRDIDKLQYLQSCLKGPALKVIQCVPIASEGYATAWNLLAERYDHQRETVFAILEDMFQQPNVRSGSSEDLHKCIDTIRGSLGTLRLLGQPVDSWDAVVVWHLRRKLDADSLREWELSLRTREVPTVVQLLKCLEGRANALAAMTKDRTLPTGTLKLQKRTANHMMQSEIVENTEENAEWAENVSRCILCEERHPISRCPEFQAASIDRRREMVRNKGLCYNCLGIQHVARSCRSRPCNRCGGRHNTLLHLDTRDGPAQGNVSSRAVYGMSGTQTPRGKLTVLPTAIVEILIGPGQSRTARALLDTGSEATFITKKCLRKLGLRYQSERMPVRGIGAVVTGATLGRIHLTIQGRSEDQRSVLKVRALVIPRITGDVPTAFVYSANGEYPEGFTLADPQFCHPGEIDMLLGADVLEKVWTGERRMFPSKPALYGSIFGWVAMGATTQSCPSSVKTLACHQSDGDLALRMERWWEVEDLPAETEWTAEERDCEEYFKESCRRVDRNRFVVKLPFNEKERCFESSRSVAVKRLQQVERRLARIPEHRLKYNSFMKEYEELGHMVRITDEELSKSPGHCCYLPHHSIHSITEASSGKFRVVFDASVKYDNGLSLNDTLMTGPKLQRNLINLLIKFRGFPVALTADIEKMYRQIGIAEEDTDFQRIVWRESLHRPIQDYKLVTVTYGTSSAPYLATRCLKQLAEEEELEFPSACQVLRNDFYMDDLISGAGTVSEAQELQRELTELLRRGGFHLRKWCSNEEDGLKHVPLEDRQATKEYYLEEDTTIKILGIVWNVKNDTFMCRIRLPTRDLRITKRGLLSEISKTFDPLGWISPFTIRMKQLLQDLWRMKTNWDAELPAGIGKGWKEYCDELQKLEHLEIPRYFGSRAAVAYQLLVFSDASTKAYAGCIYIRAQNSDGTWKATLLAAKTRVAPIKSLSLPRLELCAARLLAQLYKTIRPEIVVPLTETIAFTDSKVVLNWLSGPPRRWKVFVANRVNKILEVLPREQWRYVKSKDNPADLATRGITSKELLKAELWWKGPYWLQKEELPNEEPVEECSEKIRQEERKVELEDALQALTVSVSRSTCEWWQNFSSWGRLRAAIAYCLRFAYNSRVVKENRRTGVLSVKELQDAHLQLIKLAQMEVFEAELSHLRLGKSIPVTWKTAKLSIFLDNNQVIHVGGRLRAAEAISSHRRYPILLPKRHHLTELIVSYYHKACLHAGPQLLQTILQNRYWIIGIRDVVRGHVRKCLICVRHRAEVTKQMMGNLPRERVNPSRPFTICGVDFAGPFKLRVVKFPRGRKVYKGYLALFVCFSTRAIHLEAVSELSTPAFLATFKRFVARRGLCRDIYSDCGTNFVGANKEFKDFIKLMKSTECSDAVSRMLAEQEITWHFNPPAAPHMGGLWEAGIKSVKYHLKRIVGETVLNFEEFITILTQIEACLNSRPLMPASTDPTDLEVITPAHFLVGGPLLSVPEPDYISTKENLLSRWELLQKIVQHFWKRWNLEFLSRLQQRPKWVNPQPNLESGDLVLIKETAYPPTRWHLGRIQEIFPGKDGLVRIVNVRTAEGILRRPIHKLVKLPLDHEPTATG